MSEIIVDEEKKNNRVLARSKTMENIGASAQTPGLSRLVPFLDEAKDFIQRVDPKRNAQDIILSRENIEMFYNPKRKHANNGMLSHVNFEEQQKINPQGVKKTRGYSKPYAQSDKENSNPGALRRQSY